MLIAGTLVRGGAAAEGWVRIEGDVVAEIGAGEPPRSADVSHAGLVAGGLCDIQVNGAASVEVTGGLDALRRIEAALLAAGVTRCLATVVTSEDAVAARAVADIERRVADPLSPIAGLHLEGPFLSVQHAGVHRRELLRVPADGVPEYYGSPALRLVTLAPELDGALELIAALRARGVTVACGHSGATAGQARDAFDAGATMVTHLFNAMAPLHHRAPGLAGAALADPRVALGLICDDRHVDATVLGLVRRLAGERVVLVSDASPLAAGPARGRGALGGVCVAAGADGAPRTADGRLAGSAILLDEAVRRWVRLAGAELPEALTAAGERAASTVGLADGGLAPGGRADLVLVDDGGRMQRVMFAGRWL